MTFCLPKSKEALTKLIIKCVIRSWILILEKESSITESIVTNGYEYLIFL